MRGKTEKWKQTRIIGGIRQIKLLKTWEKLRRKEDNKEKDTWKRRKRKRQEKWRKRWR